MLFYELLGPENHGEIQPRNTNLGKVFIRDLEDGRGLAYGTKYLNIFNNMNMIDSTIVRIHQHASEAKGAIFFQALCQSVGGLTTKINILTDRNGLPLKIHLTEGKTHDSVPAKHLLKNLITDSLIGDKEYDSFDIIDFIQDQDVKS